MKPKSKCMRKQTFTILFCLLAGISVFTFVACQKEKVAKTEEQPTPVSATVLKQIASLGFSTDNVHKSGDNYLVEGDILLTPENLTHGFSDPLLLRIANTEQYRTTNRVTGLPRTVTIRVASSLGSAFVSGTDLAISRYNALSGSTLRFQRITSGTAQITISGFNQGPSGGFITLGSSGFPGGGNPYNSILMNTNSAAYGSNPNVNYVGSVIQHEIGHCIGFRHTDYTTRSSCGSNSNEGTAGVGAVLIPGTPSGADSNSFMLACSNGGNRTFNANDIIAMNYLF